MIYMITIDSKNPLNQFFFSEENVMKTNT